MHLVSGAVGEGGHHVASALRHCPAVLLGRAPEPGLAPGAVCVEGEHLLQVLKHVVKESAVSAAIAEGALLEVPLVPVHGLLVGLEVAVKVPLVAPLLAGVEVVLVPLLLLLLAKVVGFSKEVVKVERLIVLPEVVMSASSCASSSCSSSAVVLLWRRAVAKPVVLPPPLVVRKRLVSWGRGNNIRIKLNKSSGGWS